ncbi:Galactose mutarotase [Linum perenne]
MAKFEPCHELLCLSLLLLLLIAGSATEEKIGSYELKKGQMSLKLTNYGAHIISFLIPDKSGKLNDLVLGYDTPEAYKNDTQSFGATVGRVANRIGGAQFTLNGTQYKLVPNEGKNVLHGFPGDVVAVVKYTLLEYNQVSIKMKARTLNKPTPVNLINHAYWNLGGHDSGDILSQELQIFGSHYTPVDDQLIPTGKIETVVGTPFDFLTTKPVGERIGQLKLGYDLNYVLDVGVVHARGNKRGLRKAAMVHDRKSGRVMEVFTNQPGMQLYSSGQLGDTLGKNGVVYKKHSGLCLETQAFPDAVNHPNFPSTIVTPSKPYDHQMLLRFSTS